MGSRLYQLGREKPAARQALAAQYVAEALQGERELKVRSVELTPEGDGAQVAVFLDWRGETLAVQLKV